MSRSANARSTAILAGALLVAFACPALSEGADTGDLFGFSDGSDIGDKGDRSFEFDTLTRIGKRAGDYRALSATAAAKATLTDDIAVGLGIGATRNFVKNVPGLANVNTGGLAGVSGEFKYRVLERASSPFGLTLIAAPGYARLDGEGLRTSEFGIGFRAAIDRELVKDKLYGAINFDYAPSWTWPRGGAAMERGSSAGISGALSMQISDGIFLGAEARYEHAASGLFFGDSQGHAVFVGPTFYAKIGKDAFIAGAWGRQIAGRANEVQRSLDLDNFERNVFRARFAIAF